VLGLHLALHVHGEELGLLARQARHPCKLLPRLPEDRIVLPAGDDHLSDLSANDQPPADKTDAYNSSQGSRILDSGEGSHARPFESCPMPILGAIPRLPEEGDWYFIAEQPAPAPHLAHPEGCAALRIVLGTVPRVSHSYEHFPDGFDLHLLQCRRKTRKALRELSDAHA